MPVYTKTGDKGETSLANGSRISKSDARIEAYGTVDELNSWIGMLRASLANSQQPTTNSQLQWLQNKLFNLGAALSLAPGEWITEADVHQLELWIDEMQAQVPRQKAFILPAGSEAVCRCHVCRTICRRTERKMILLDPDPTLLQFINRTSDFLFLLARFIAFSKNEEEEAWNSK
jgi:cob(I)alamin adenosyltransferase